MRLDREEIDDYRQRQFFETPKSAHLDGTTIFFAVVSAIIFCWFLKTIYEEWQMRQALALFNEQMKAVEIQTKNELRKVQIQNEVYRAQREQQLKMQAERNALLKIQKYQAEQEKQAIFAAQIAERNAKELARKSFYKPMRGCESENPNRDIIMCGNDYIRANKKFEESWAKSNQH